MVLRLLFEWVVDDSFEMSECGLCKRQKGADTGREQWKRGKKERLVGLIAIIVDRSIAHPANLAEFLALFSSKYLKCGSICIDICIVVIVVVPIIGLLRIGMKRSAI